MVLGEGLGLAQVLLGRTEPLRHVFGFKKNLNIGTQFRLVRLDRPEMVAARFDNLA